MLVFAHLDGLVLANTPQANLCMWVELEPSSVRVVELDELDSPDHEDAEEEDGYKPVKKCVEVKVHNYVT